MDMSQIAYFLSIAETQNITRSAERLHVAQPSISRSMARLERELGVNLFSRAGRGIALTAEGRALACRLAPVAAELDGISRMFDPAPRQTAVKIRLAAASELASEALSHWIEGNPAVRIVLSQGIRRADDVDIDISDEPCPRSVDQRRFVERIMIAASKPLALDEEPLALSRLADEPFISLSAAYGFAQTVRALCDREGFEPDVVFESNNPSVVRRFIAMGIGIGFWPEKSWGDAASTGLSLHPVQGDPARSIHASLTEAGTGNPCARACFEAIVARFAAAFA